MTLSGMRLVGDVPPFTNPIEFEFNDRVNVLIGPNASGKSTVLLMLANHFMEREDHARPIPQKSTLRRALQWPPENEDLHPMTEMASDLSEDEYLHPLAEALSEVGNSMSLMDSQYPRFSAAAWADLDTDARVYQLNGDGWFKTITRDDPEGDQWVKRDGSEINQRGENAPATIWIDANGNEWTETSQWTKTPRGAPTLIGKGLNWIDAYGREQSIIFDIDGEVMVATRPDDSSRNTLWVNLDWFDTYGIYPTPGDPAPPELKPSVVHIESIREPLPGITEAKQLDADAEAVDEILEGRFSGLALVRACLGLTNTLSSEKPGGPDASAQAQLLAAIALADQCSKAICDEVVLDGETRNYVADQFALSSAHNPLESSVTITVLRMLGVNTNDARNFEYLPLSERPSEAANRGDFDQPSIYLGHLSSGTAGTLLWIRWLALKILHHYEFAEGWEKQPAILLIDEIENHLHPTWQRRVIPALLEHFPGLQIFATTHSPFVVAGLKAGQVHLLNRDENGVVTASTNQQDVVGWTADEILRVYMGVGDPTDEQTARAGAELRRLRDMGPLADEREEEQRQTRIRELREIVNIAVLDGPRAAEDARFAATLEGILERYRQSKDLNQENGRDA